MKMRSKLSCWALAFALFCLIAAPAYAQQQSGPGVSITSNSPFTVTDLSGSTLARFGAATMVSVVYSNGSYFISAAGYSSRAEGGVRFVPSGGLLQVKDMASSNYSRYRGVLEVRYSKISKRLWVINELSFRDYLNGIGEEPESFGNGYLDAMKAAVIAFRSYAYAEKTIWRKFGSEPFDISSSTRFAQPYEGASQWYIGYYRETLGSRLATAVRETNGVCVVYGGRVAKTPYFSKSDGWTRSSSVYPWCKAVPEEYDLPPHSPKTPLQGHGLGMSMNGAAKRAQAGFSYEDILKHYFSNVRLSKVFDDSSETIRVGIYSTTVPSSVEVGAAAGAAGPSDVSFANLAAGQAVGARVEVAVNATPDVKRVVFYVDGKLKKVDRKAPFVARLRISEGQHTITIVGLGKDKQPLAQRELLVIRR